MKLSVIGTGYVGLVTGACFAEMGNTVICVDKDRAKIQALLTGRLPVHAPGLAQLVEANRRAERLRFTTSLRSMPRRSSAASTAASAHPNRIPHSAR